MAKKTNDIAKWIIVAIAIATIIFNSAILWNDVKHIKQRQIEDRKATQNELIEIKMDVKSINAYLLQQSKEE